MVHLADTRRWQQAIKSARERSRWGLSDEDVERHLGLAYDLTMDMMIELGRLAGAARALDPSGADALRRVKRWRRRALLGGALLEPDLLLKEAEERYPLPTMDLGFWQESTVERPWKLLSVNGTAPSAVSPNNEDEPHGKR